MYKKIAILVLLVSISFAQEKIGVVYSERILLEYEKFTDALEQLDLAVRGKVEEYEKMQTELDSMLSEYSQQSLITSPDLKKAKEQEMGELQNSMQTFSLTLQNDLTKTQRQLEYNANQQIKQAVEDVAAKEGYTLVIDGSMATQYVNPRLNITDDVLTELKKSYDKSTE